MVARVIVLTYVAIILIAFSHCATGVWKSCRSGRPEFAAYHCGYGARWATFLGIYMNTGSVATKRSVGKLLTGVLLNQARKINYPKLKQSLAAHLEGSNAVTIKPEDIHEFKINEEAEVTIPPNTAVIVVQMQATCAGKDRNKNKKEKYWRRESEEEDWSEIPDALVVSSGPIIAGSVNLSENCANKDFPTLRPDKEHPFNKVVENQETYPMKKQLPYREGVWFDDIIDLKRPPLGEGSQDLSEFEKLTVRSWVEDEPGPKEEIPKARANDDTGLFLKWLDTKMGTLNPSPSSGLDWSKQRLNFTRLGRIDKEFTLDVPPKGYARAFQATLSCGPVRVDGWAFRTWYTDEGNANFGEGEDCKTPEIQPVCMTVGQGRPGTPATYLYNSECQDTFTKLVEPESWRSEPKDQTKITFSLEGPFVDRIDEKFKAVFLDKVHALGSTGRTGFNWTTVSDLNLHIAKNETKTQVEANQVALQLEVECGRYKVRTDKVAIVDKNSHGDCENVTGLAMTCNQVEAWIF